MRSAIARRGVMVGFAGILVWGSIHCGNNSQGRAEQQPVVRLFWAGGSNDGKLATTITAQEVRLAFARARFEREGHSHNAGPLPTSLKDSILSDWVRERMLLCQADELRVSVSTTALERAWMERTQGIGTKEMTRQLVDHFDTQADAQKRLHDRLRIAALLRHEAHRGVTIREAEIQDAYRALTDEQKAVPRRAHVRQIVVPTEVEGERVLSLLKKGGDFEALAKKHGTGPEAARGGEVGWISPKAMPEVFDACFSMRPNEISPLLASDFGFHIFQVLAVTEPRERAFEEMRATLSAQLLFDKLQDAERRYVEKLATTFLVRRDDKRLASLE